jgi:4-amino-4-deoxy-L-arabinose transferase-like glycosyltransferase
MLFGALADAGSGPAGKTAIFGACCLLVAAAGIVRVLWRWRTARRAEQLLLVAIIVNIGVYTISTLPTPQTPHDIVTVLPAGAILGARALVPAHVTTRLTGLVMSATAVVAALLPLSLAASQPAQVPPWAALTTWLRAHGLRYGLGGYWDGSSVTLLSGDQVQVRTVELKGGQITPFPWETNTLWYDPARHYANFVVIDLIYHDLGPNAERFFGEPVSTQRLGRWEVLIYRHNVLRQVKPPRLPSVS